MEILKINLKKPELYAIKKAVSVIRKGGILVYPTDTCYGLGIDPGNKKSLQKLLTLKARKNSKKISVVVSDLKMIKNLCRVGRKEEVVLRELLPGRYTFVLKTKDGETLGVRIPDCSVTSMLAQELNHPYTTTSANRSGRSECYNISCVLNQLREHEKLINLILDVGDLPKNPSSSVIDLTVWPPSLIR